MNRIENEIKRLGVIAVLVVNQKQDAIPLGRALVKGGMTVAEVTLRTDDALEAITAMTTVDGLITGAGTVLSAGQARAAVKAGAAFLVSPGLDEGVVEAAREMNIPLYPGVATATEVQRAWNLGLRTVKLFPAEIVGGPKTIKALSAVFRDMAFVPTGGISLENIENYLSLPSVFACGGSWIAPEKLIEDGNFEEITIRAAKALQSAKQIRDK